MSTIRPRPDATEESQRTMMDFVSAGDVPANSEDVSGEAQDGFMRIGEMAKVYGVTLRTLRFYEDKGLINPKREGTSRLYSRRDRVRLKLILLGRKVGFSLRDVKQMIDLYDPTGSNIKQLKLTLEKSEKQLARLNKQRQALDEAIGDLTQGMTAVRGMLETRQAKARSN
jgi:DNA-binding transcriptional MerR regulator